MCKLLSAHLHDYENIPAWISFPQENGIALSYDWASSFELANTTAQFSHSYTFLYLVVYFLFINHSNKYWYTEIQDDPLKCYLF